MTKTVAVFILVALLVIDGLLIFRVWAQSTGQPIDSAAMEAAFDTTDFLAAPFEVFTGEPPLRQTRVIDFTVLVAAEAYFAGFIALLTVSFLLSRIVVWVQRRRKPQLPDFVVAQMQSRQLHLRTTTSGRVNGARLLVRSRKPRRPGFSRSGLGADLPLIEP